MNLIFAALALSAVIAFSATADSYTLVDGKTVSGDMVSFDQRGVILKLPDGKYAEPVAWEKFSQDDLKKISEKNPKTIPFVEPLIVETIEEKRAKTAIEVKTNFVQLARPPSGSLIGGLLSSPLGILLLLLIYAANIYAAYEIAIFRAQPPGLVCGLSAIGPIIVPIIFLSMPMRVPKAAVDEWAAEEQLEGAPEGEGMGEFTVAEEGGLKMETPEAAAPAHPATQTFARGQFTFNRRFLETKFSGFFMAVKRAGDKDMVLVIKSARGTYIVDRIPRISANELYAQVTKGHVSEEVMIPFLEIQEIQLKHKDAP